MLNVNIKDSDWPEWANWVAQDNDGEVYFFEKEPKISSISNTWTNLEAGECMMHCSGDINSEWKTAIMERPTVKSEAATSDGSTASYYELPNGCEELQDLISYRDMNSQIGEIFRACYRYGQGHHSPKMRDIKKIIFYAQAELKRLELLERGNG